MLAETTAGKASWVLGRIRRALMDVPYETRRGEMKVAITAGSASTERGCADVAQLMRSRTSNSIVSGMSVRITLSYVPAPMVTKPLWNSFAR